MTGWRHWIRPSLARSANRLPAPPAYTSPPSAVGAESNMYPGSCSVQFSDPLTASTAETMPSLLRTKTWPVSYARPDQGYVDPTPRDHRTAPVAWLSAYSVLPAVVTYTLPLTING